MTAKESTKICPLCKQVVPISDFHKSARSPDGKRPECKQCRRSVTATYRKRQGAVLIRKAALYVARNKLQVAARAKRWRSKNREKLKQQKRADYIRNFDRYSEKKRIYAAKHPEHNKATTQRRRAKLRGVRLL